MIISPLPLSFLTAGTNRFDVKTQLFGSSEQGFWYDISDISTLYQDSAATTPVTAVGDPVGYVTDISGNGNHATQSTGADRPIFGRWPQSAVIAGFVRNELVNTATLSTQDVTVTAATRTLSFKGTGTVTLSNASTAGPLVGTGANDRVSLTFTPSAGTLTLTVSGSVTDAQLEIGSSVTGIQIVGASSNYDVTESGQPNRYFLYFNGTNHNLSTASIDFSGSDEMSVFAGVSKFNGDSDQGFLIELGNAGDPGRRAGSFTFGAESGSSGSHAFSQHSGGTTTQFANITASSDISPLSAIYIGLGKFPDSISIRKDGTQANSNAASAGSGPYRNDIVYIGCRNISSSFLEGNIYQLGTRGALTSGSTLSGAENFIGQRMKGYL